VGREEHLDVVVAVRWHVLESLTNSLGDEIKEGWLVPPRLDGHESSAVAEGRLGT
jgi:hypothetical protein